MRANHLRNLSLAVATFTAVASGSALAASAPTGVWIDHTGRGAVEIKDCGNGSLCGHVVWTKDSADSKGCGLQILGNVKSVGSNQWDNGWIYSPEKKQKFSVELTPLDSNRLRVKGYKGIKLLSKTMVWHRAAGNLQRCDSTTTAKAVPEPKPNTATAEPVAKTARASEPKVINSAPGARDSEVTTPAEQRTAKVTPAPQMRDALGNGTSDSKRSDREPKDDDQSSIYAEPPQGDQARGDNGDGERSSENLNGLGELLEKFGSKDGIEVGDGYGMKVVKGPNGEKTCRLDVPFVTVNIPCED